MVITHPVTTVRVSTRAVRTPSAHRRGPASAHTSAHPRTADARFEDEHDRIDDRDPRARPDRRVRRAASSPPPPPWGTRRVRADPRRSRVVASAGSGEKLGTDKTYNCVVTEDGVIVAKDIPSGVYEVSAWWAGATSGDEDEQPLAPRCDSERQRGCEECGAR